MSGAAPMLEITGWDAQRAGAIAPSDPPTFVLVHGASDTAATWADVGPALAALPARHRWVAPNLPGRLGSAGPPCASASEAADRVAALVRALGLARVIVVGHSFGGAIALELALGPMRDDPALVGLGLVATGARLRVHPAILAAARTGGAAARVDPAVPEATVLADWLAVDAFDRLGALAGVRVPCLVAVGTRDVLTPPKYADHLGKELARVTRATFEGAGHHLPRERPAELAAALAAFAESTVGRGGDLRP